MTTKRTRFTESDVDTTKGAHHREPKHQWDNNNDLSGAHILLKEEFIDFCKSKISNQDNKLDHHSKKIHNTVKKTSIDSYNFKEKLVLYFGDYLPATVINELCALVHENSYDKCSYCALPTESLVLGVLQILVDAGSKICESVDKNVHVSASKVTNPTKVDRDEADRTMQKSAEGNKHASMLMHTKRMDKVNFISSREALDKNETTYPDQNQCFNDSPHVGTENPIGTKDTFDAMMGKMKNIIVLDTPLVMKNKSCYGTMFESDPESINPMKKRIKLDHSVSRMCPLASTMSQIHDPLNVVIDVDEIKNKDLTSHEILHQNAKGSSDRNVLVSNANARSCDLAKISDQIYNQKNFPASDSKKNAETKSIKSVEKEPSNMLTKTFVQLKSTSQLSPQFQVTDEERRYYDIMCGLAYSQWKCFPAVKFYKTSVTYSSLGESVEPGGLVDNFFITGFCCKLFEDYHPRRSKKHYFYPTVGGCLLTYNSQYDITVVKNSFHGTNSAHKLHLSEKLCFPVW